MSQQNRILVLFVHPAVQKSRINRRLFVAAQKLEGVTCHDLYQAYPDYQIDIAREQALLLEHDVIVFQHPFYWYSSPALLKEWQDLVLEYGFAYGRQGTRLAGKVLFNAITTGGGQDAYRRGGLNHYSVRELLAPFEQTARLCGMIYLPPYVVHGAIQLTDTSQIENQAEAYTRLLAALRDRRLAPEEAQALRQLNDAVPLKP